MEEQDQLIKNLMEKASKKEAEIGKIQNYSNQTNLSFPLERGTSKGSINLNVIHNVEALVEAATILIKESESSKKAAELLGVTYEFSWGGFTEKEWLEDIRNRIDTINLRKKKAELKEIKDVLNSLLSPEAKKMKQLEEIAKRLDDN
jgi:hypothetical protein